MEKMKLTEKHKFHLLARAQFICCGDKFFKPMYWAEPDVKISFKTSPFGRKGLAKVSIIYKYYDYDLEVGCVYDRHYDHFEFKYVVLDKVFGISQDLRIDEHMTVIGSLHHTFDDLLYEVFGCAEFLRKEMVTPKLHTKCEEDSEEGEADVRDGVCHVEADDNSASDVNPYLVQNYHFEDEDEHSVIL